MDLDLIGFMENIFQNTWFNILVILAIISGGWYYIKHVAKGTGGVKNLLVGGPLQLIIILAALISIIALIIHIFDIGLVSSL